MCDRCCEKKPCCPKVDCCSPKIKTCCEKVECCCPVMDDCLAREIECLWKKAFCDATIVPCLGQPSKTCGVLWLTHTLGKSLGKCPHTINGLPIRSPLVNNAQYTAEVSNCQWVNLYEIMLPDIPGKCGCKSSTEVYVEALVKLGISVEGDHYHWKGMCPHSFAIHSKALGMDPQTFTKKQIAAIKATIEYINCSCNLGSCDNQGHGGHH